MQPLLDPHTALERSVRILYYYHCVLDWLSGAKECSIPANRLLFGVSNSLLVEFHHLNLNFAMCRSTRLPPNSLPSFPRCSSCSSECRTTLQMLHTILLTLSLSKNTFPQLDHPPKLCFSGDHENPVQTPAQPAHCSILAHPALPVLYLTLVLFP